MPAPAPARTLRPVPAPARRPPGAPAPARRLRVVDDARMRNAARRRRTRLVVVMAAVFAAGCLFALAAFNALLVTGQGRLDQLQQQVAEAQSEYSANRLRVAELEAPAHIVRVAQERLGMRPPDAVTYLTPSEAMAEEAGTRTIQERPVEDGGDTTGWASMKPYLGSRP